MVENGPHYAYQMFFYNDQLIVWPDDFELYDSILDVEVSAMTIYYAFNSLYVVYIF